MPRYELPDRPKPPKIGKKQALLIASGDLRLSANQKCWPAQAEMERALTEAVTDCGFELVRVHTFKEDQRHGFIDSKRSGNTRITCCTAC